MSDWRHSSSRILRSTRTVRGYVTNRVGIGARGLRPGPDAALLSVTGRSPVPRVSPTPPAIFRNTNHARIPEESGPTPPTATGVTTSVGGSPVEFAGRRYRGQVALDRFGRRHVDSRQLKTWAVNGTSTRRAPAERPGGRWKTGVAATANGPGSCLLYTSDAADDLLCVD